MYSIPRRMSQAAQAQIESQLDAGAMLMDKAMSSMQQMAGLNFNLARATLEQSNFVTRQFMSAQDARQILSLVAAQLEPNAWRTLDYSYYLTTITAQAQAGLIEIVGDRMADTGRELSELVEDMGRETPSGLRAAIQLIGALTRRGTAENDEGPGAWRGEGASAPGKAQGTPGSAPHRRLANGRM